MATKKTKVSKAVRGGGKAVSAKPASARGRKATKPATSKKKKNTKSVGKAASTPARAASRPAKKRPGSKTMTRNTSTRSATKGGKSGARRTKPAATATVVDLEVMPDASEIERRIAERAYLLWCERGGDETSNWLEAERQIVSELGSSR